MNPQEVFRKSMPRNVMRAFKIDEISAVDYPAQQGARAVLMKAATPTPVSFATFEEAVSFLRKSSASRTEAMSKAATMFPALLAKFRNDLPTTRPTVAKSAASLAAQQLALAAEGIRARSPSMSRTAALQQARREHPRLIEAMRG